MNFDGLERCCFVRLFEEEVARSHLLLTFFLLLLGLLFKEFDCFLADHQLEYSLSILSKLD
jgi:hypothetical protein